MGTECSLMQIVLAEDNPADVFLVREALKNHGIECELKLIADGEEAVRYIDRLDFDSKAPCPALLLLDMHLPKRDGGQILAHLRASERCGQTPVVIMTASDSPATQESAEKHAVLHYFRKPSSFEQFMNLGAVVKDVLGQTEPAVTDKME